jgi:predicted nucleotidyltransferase
MEIERDFKELLELLNSHEVEYIIVGGFALAFHGAPRFTGDLDIFLKADPENAKRVVAALSDFGFGSVGLSEGDFTVPNQVIQLGVPPVRVDLITSISGVQWDHAWSDSVAADLNGISVRFISKKHFIANKKASGRKKDLADLEALGE